MNHYSTCFLRVKTELTESSNRPNRFWDNTRIFLLLMQTKYSNRRLYFKLLTQQSRKRHDILQSNDMETEVEKKLSHSVNHTSDSHDVCREDGATSEAVNTCNYQIQILQYRFQRKWSKSLPLHFKRYFKPSFNDTTIKTIGAKYDGRTYIQNLVFLVIQISDNSC